MADDEGQIHKQGITLAAIPGGVLITLHGLKEAEGEVLQLTMDPLSVRGLAQSLKEAADTSTELLVQEMVALGEGEEE